MHTLEKEKTFEGFSYNDELYDRELRLYDDTTTWLAEVLNGHMRTSFEYHFDGEELYAQDGSSVGQIFKESLESSEHLHPSLSFEVRRRQHELDEYSEMLTMMRDDSNFNTMVVVSDFPEELINMNQDVGGYNISRKQTMLRVIYKTEEGTLKMVSQSLDRSDRQALEEIYRFFNIEPQAGELLGQRIYAEIPSDIDKEFLVDQLTWVYDSSLTKQYGGEWNSGRPKPKTINTYDFVRSQDDLIELYCRKASKIGDQSEILRGVAALMMERYELVSSSQSSLTNLNESVELAYNYYQPIPIIEAQLYKDIEQAATRATSRGQKFSGCGLTLQNSDVFGAEDELSQQGYGNKTDEDKYGSLTFKCKKGCTNKRQRNQLIENCQKCGESVRC